MIQKKHAALDQQQAINMATAVMALPIQISVQRPLVASDALAMGVSAAADSRPVVDEDDEELGGGGVA